MKSLKFIHPIFFILIMFLTIAGCSKTKVTPLAVSQYKGVFTAPPSHIPTGKTPDGPIAGNGDVGLVYSGTPESQRFYISKNDFWKSKPGYPDGGVFLPGGLDIQVDALKGAAYHAEQVLENATLTADFKTAESAYSLQTWVAAGDNIIILEFESEGKPYEVKLNLWTQTGHESVNESGQDGDLHWVTRKFETPDLEWPTRIAIVMKVIDKGGSAFQLDPSGKVQVAIGVCTNHDQENYLEAAKAKVKDLGTESIRQLREEHVSWWKGFWSQSMVNIGDTLIEKYYYGSQYLLASCSRNINFPPGLWGNSLTEDASFENWVGDYHLNYNHQSPWWGVFSSNQIALADPYDTPILEYMENAKKHAREYLNCRGVYYPVGIGPKGFCPAMYPLTAEKMQFYYKTPETNIENGYMFLGQKSNAVFASLNMLLRYYYTYDTEYARKVYPFLLEVANFWEDYLKFENGRYVSYNDNVGEVGPWQGKDWKKNYGDINPVGSLGYLRIFFKGIMDISNDLKTDSGRQDKWLHIYENLSAIPTAEVDGRVRILGSEGGTGSGSRMIGARPGFMWKLLFPLPAFNTNEDTRMMEILLSEAKLWNEQQWDHAHSGGFEIIFSSAVRLGMDPEYILEKLTNRLTNGSYPNLWVPSGGGGVETLNTVPAAINEMLLQGHGGFIRVFPNWVRERDASFNTLRAIGAFLVSSSLKQGEVEYVKLHSEKGRPCVIENPWGDGNVNLERNGKKAGTLTGKLLKLETVPGEEIVLKPADNE
jgi:alpha-L-fucosidase 2